MHTGLKRFKIGLNLVIMMLLQWFFIIFLKIKFRLSLSALKVRIFGLIILIILIHLILNR